MGGFDIGEIPDDMMRTNSELDTDPMWQFGNGFGRIYLFVCFIFPFNCDFVPLIVCFFRAVNQTEIGDGTRRVGWV